MEHGNADRAATISNKTICAVLRFMPRRLPLSLTEAITLVLRTYRNQFAATASSAGLFGDIPFLIFAGRFSSLGCLLLCLGDLNAGERLARQVRLR